MNQAEEMKIRYEKRKKRKNDYSFFSPWYLYAVQGRERSIIDILKKNGINSFKDIKIMDVGCGTGNWLRMFMQWGAVPENLYGVDILEERIEEAKKKNPNINFTCATAEKIDFPDRSFDIVVLATCLTSVLDTSAKSAIAKEALRILKQNGFILWYDFRYNNPWNPDVKGIEKKELKSLFKNCSFDFRLITLAPPIARKIADVSLLLCDILAVIPFLRTHYLAAIKKLP